MQRCCLCKSKTVKISFENTLSLFICQFSFTLPLDTLRTLNWPLSNQLGNFSFMSGVLLFVQAPTHVCSSSHDVIRTCVAFRRRVKDGETIVHKHTQFIKVKLCETFVSSKLLPSYMHYCYVVLEFEIFFHNGGRSSEIWFESSFRQKIGMIYSMISK